MCMAVASNLSEKTERKKPVGIGKRIDEGGAAERRHLEKMLPDAHHHNPIYWASKYAWGEALPPRRHGRIHAPRGLTRT